MNSRAFPVCNRVCGTPAPAATQATLNALVKAGYLVAACERTLEPTN